ncbi:MAG TPA: arsenate reductase ArsC [Bryobacteraceae bacterium]|nr:arsenate reductase ArsC [Bryobacteraceae bacterium]
MKKVKKVLFLCIGNSCRSQMAEGFARRYGSDVMDVASAGLAPAPIVQPLTRKVMEAKNINIDDQFPKDLHDLPVGEFDLIVNMSGNRLPPYLLVQVQDWRVDDPIGKSEETYIAVRELIEGQVMRLILDFRRVARLQKKSRPPLKRVPLARLHRGK